MSSDDFFGLLIAIAILGTFIIHLYYVVGAIYRRRWQFVAKIGSLFALYLVVIVFSFLFAVGLCAAGCPSGLDAVLGLLYVGLSIGFVLRLHKLHRRQTNEPTPTATPTKWWPAPPPE